MIILSKTPIILINFNLFEFSCDHGQKQNMLMYNVKNVSNKQLTLSKNYSKTNKKKIPHQTEQMSDAMEP